MIVEPVIVDIIDKTRIECNLFWRPNVIKLRGVPEAPQIVVVLGPWHRGR